MQRSVVEARALARLRHPNIVIVYDMGKSGDVAYMATELLDGQTLREILDSGVTIPPGMIEQIGAEAADGLDFMHQHSIVHGDISPSTIVVLDIGLVKIAHLGNALFPAGSRMPAESVRASPHYMSPEQATGNAIDARSDIFSLGCVVYEMLAGVAPFTGSAADEVVAQIINKNPAPPSARNHNIRSGFDYIVARAMAKDPDHRYQTAREMASDLRKWALEEPRLFPTPLAHVSTVQTARSRSAAVTLPHEPFVQGEVVNDVSSGSRTRRQLLFYGIPAALFAVSGTWAILSRRTPSQESPLRESIGKAAPPTPMAEAALATAVQSVQRVDAAPALPQPPAIEPAGLSAAEPLKLSATRPVARLGFAVSPWGEIYVDGKKKGISPPLREIELPPGKYRIEIKNTVFPPRTQSIDVKAKARLKIKHKFK